MINECFSIVAFINYNLIHCCRRGRTPGTARKPGRPRTTGRRWNPRTEGTARRSWCPRKRRSTRLTRTAGSPRSLRREGHLPQVLRTGRRRLLRGWHTAISGSCGFSMIQMMMKAATPITTTMMLAIGTADIEKEEKADTTHHTVRPSASQSPPQLPQQTNRQTNAFLRYHICATPRQPNFCQIYTYLLFYCSSVFFCYHFSPFPLYRTNLLLLLHKTKAPSLKKGYIGSSISLVVSI